MSIYVKKKKTKLQMYWTLYNASSAFSAYSIRKQATANL